MKKIKVLLFVALTLGLVFFQLNFVSDNSDLFTKSWLGTNASAADESYYGNNYTPHYSSTPCGYVTVETWTYYSCSGTVLGTKVWINGVLQSPFYNGSSCYSTFTSSTKTAYITTTTCEGGSSSCTPYTSPCGM